MVDPRMKRSLQENIARNEIQRELSSAVRSGNFRDFLLNLYEHSDKLRVVTAQATYLNKEDFLNKYPDTAYNNIGSIMQPMNYEDACLCE